MSVTQEDIAQKLNISRRLVGYALSGHPGVNESTRRQIEEMAHGMGYRPHRVAQALASGHTYQIALCFPCLAGSYYSEIISQFEILTRGTPYHVVITSFDPENPDADYKPLTVDGTIFVAPASQMPRMLQPPVVVMQSELRRPMAAGEEKLDRIQLNIGDATRDAIGHLLDQGFERFLYVAPQHMMHSREPRFYGYCEMLNNAGLQYALLPLEVPGEQRLRQQARQMLLCYFEERELPQAIFCGNDDVAIAAYRALDQLGYHIPGDVAIVGFDDLDEVQYLHPPLTSVHLPVETLCANAWRMLMERLENPALPPRYEQFPAHLVVRQSSTGKSAVPAQ